MSDPFVKMAVELTGKASGTNWKTAKAVVGGKMNTWEFAKSVFDWDGFKEHWKFLGEEVKNEVFGSITETAGDFWDNLTGADKLAASDEALKRAREGCARSAGRSRGRPGRGRRARRPRLRETEMFDK